MLTSIVRGTKLVPDVDKYGNCYGYNVASAQLTIDDIVALREELNKLKGENLKLTEWLSYGKYSAK